MIKKITKLFQVSLVLNGIIIAWIVLLCLLFGTESFSPYFKQMAAHIMSSKDMARTLIILTLSGLSLELFLRKFLHKKIRPFGKATLLIPILIYALINAYFGWIGFVYGLGTGAIITLAYERRQSCEEVCFWHAQWGLFLIGTCLSLCVLTDGKIRQDFLFSYKKRHLKKGLLYYRENWGWVDKIHYRRDHFREIDHAFKEGLQSFTMSDGWVTPLKIDVQFSATYKISPTQDPELRWAQTCAIMLDFMCLNERVQENSPWYHGNQLSAWQFDDVSSALLCSLDHLPKSISVQPSKDITDEELLLEKWRQLGYAEVCRKVDSEASWEQAGQQFAPLRDKVARADHLWQRLSTTLPQ